MAGAGNDASASGNSGGDGVPTRWHVGGGKNMKIHAYEPHAHFSVIGIGRPTCQRPAIPPRQAVSP